MDNQRTGIIEFILSHKKASRIIIISILVLIAIGYTVIEGLYSQSSFPRAASDAGAGSEQAPARTGGAWEDSRQLITYKGKKYRYNTHLSNYLFLGIDKTGNLDTEGDPENAGQADALFLVVYDRKERTVRLLAIPRDTISAIYTYDLKGNPVGSKTDHLSLQFAYGDGRYLSCRITCDAVSNLLYDTPILGYAAINLTSIPYLVDAMGGVTLTVPDDSMEAVNPAYKAGTEITLTAETAEAYLRHRDLTRHHQALVRMERQKSFIDAFLNQLMTLYARDSQAIEDLYAALTFHVLTNMYLETFLELAEAKRLGGIETIPGEGAATELYDEFHVDEKALYEMLLDVFYVEAA